ncbi:group XV phospholipase A2-like [Lingula anatina]|nr:group XV phospholipase A2-like [Lingula anatina]|eukprot:XP_013400988.1 group XV phospholipase A2-like [Lingula anatina]
MVQDLLSMGYVRNQSVRGAPYDFRKAPNEQADFFLKFKQLIEETFTMNNNSRVVLVGHSMGNMYTLYFLNHQPQQWKDKYIRSFVSLAGPWGGAAKTLRLMSSGDSLGFYSIILNPLEIRPQQRSMPSTAWLLPTDSVWSPDDVLVSRPGYNYTLKDYKKFFQDLNFMDGWYMRQDTEGLTRKLSPPGVEVHCVHGLGVKTPAAFSFTEKQWPDSQPTVTYSNGDGTVNSRSLEGCLLWQERQPQSVYHYVIPNAEHMQLLYNADAIKIIKKVAGSDTP